MTATIKFKLDWEKAIETLVWLANECPRIGQVVETGRIEAPDDILAEALAEVGPGAVQVGTGAPSQPMKDD